MSTKKGKRKKKRSRGVPASVQLRELSDSYFNACTGLSETPLPFISTVFERHLSSKRLITKLAFSREMGDKQAIALANALTNYHRLNHLCMWETGVSDLGLGALSNYIANDSSIISFDFMNNCVSPHGFVALGKALETNKSLCTLKLDNNDVGNHGTRHLALGIGENIRNGGKLHTLSLQYCRVGEEGAESLAEEAFVCTNSAELNDKKEGESSTSAFLTPPPRPKKYISPGKASKKKKAVIFGLKSLDLQGNAIGKAGVSALLLGMRESMVLEKINLHDCHVTGRDQDVWTLLPKSLANVLTLKSIDIGNNDLGNENAKLLLEVAAVRGNIVQFILPLNIENSTFRKMREICRKAKTRSTRRRKSKLAGDRKQTSEATLAAVAAAESEALRPRDSTDGLLKQEILDKLTDDQENQTDEEGRAKQGARLAAVFTPGSVRDTIPPKPSPRPTLQPISRLEGMRAATSSGVEVVSHVNIGTGMADPPEILRMAPGWVAPADSIFDEENISPKPRISADHVATLSQVGLAPFDERSKIKQNKAKPRVNFRY